METSPEKLKSLYEKGENISAYLRKEQKVLNNTRNIIEISYDLQTGSYIEAMKDEAVREHKINYSREIANTILTLCKPSSILEAGVGEGITLAGVLQHIDASAYGFDLSWSRAFYSMEWLRENGIEDAIICTGDLMNIPFADNSIDVVYTAHSIEPNGGFEEQILKELYRVTISHLILIEPAYELANSEARERMVANGYCRGLKEISERLGYKVLDYRLFPYSIRPLNPTGVILIEKQIHEKSNFVLACPKYKTPLEEIGNVMYSPKALTAYPIISKIPCLKIENGIFASKFMESVQGA